MLYQSHRLRVLSLIALLFFSFLISAEVQSASPPANELNSESFSRSLASTNALDGQIIVDPNNPAWLKYKNGGPFFMCGPGDPEDFLYRGTQNADGTRQGDQMALIEKLVGTGANSIYFQAIRSHGGDGDSTHNPFIDNDPSKGINDDVLDQWETWFSEMDKNGIVIYFFFYDDSARIWNTGDQVGNNERNFIRTLVNKFEHHKNLIWVVAEEYQERYSSTRVSNIAAEIRQADDYNHVIAVHKLSGLDFSEFANDPNIDQFAIQYNVNSASALHQGMVNAWGNANGKYNLNMSEAANYGAGATARKKSWAIAMGGAYVMQYRMNIADTSINDLNDCGRLVNFMESTNFHQMSPRDGLAWEDTEYVLASPGRSYIAYASNLSGSIGLKNMEAGAYNFKWYDTTNGRTVIQENVNVAAGNQAWDKPSTLGNELAVYITRDDDGIAITPTSTATSSAQPTNEPTQPAATATPTPISTVEPTPSPDIQSLLIDTFDRSDSTSVGNGWAEIEGGEAEVGIKNNRLHFIDTSDLNNRPIVQHNFSEASKGQLTWNFDFDWERGNGEGTYRLLMQLGNSDLMNNSSQNDGVGINLIWTQIDGVHEMLGYRKNGTNNGLTKLDQPSRVSVTVDLDNFTYTVAIDGQLIEEVIPFDNSVTLDTVRFLTDELNEENVYKRNFDNIEIKTLSEQSTPTPVATLTPTPTSTDVPVATPTQEPGSDMPLLIFDGPSSVKPGETFDGSILLQNVTDSGLYGIQLELVYDPNLLSIENLQVNPNLPIILKNEAGDASGVVTLVASQQGAQPGLTGYIAILNFEVTAANMSGVMDLDFRNVKVSDPQAVGINVISQSHRITIETDNTPQPTATPTEEPTSVPTATPTNEPTPVPTATPTNEPATPTPPTEPTATPTGMPSASTLSGQVMLPGRNDNNWTGVVVIVSEVDQTPYSATTDLNGNFLFSELPSDITVSISANITGYLPAECTGLEITTSLLNLTPVTLVSGDINNDNLIDIADATAVGSGFNQTGSDLSPDINDDEIIDIFDLVLVSSNFGASGVQPWNCYN